MTIATATDTTVASESPLAYAEDVVQTARIIHARQGGITSGEVTTLKKGLATRHKGKVRFQDVDKDVDAERDRLAAADAHKSPLNDKRLRVPKR